MYRELSIENKYSERVNSWTHHLHQAAAAVTSVTVMMDSASVACAENISLFRLLTEVPEPPSVNTSLPQFHDSSNYTLPLLKERALVGVLGFLSSVINDGNCITAVCIHERRDSDTLEAHIAINKERRKDNNALLYTICTGFNTIFARLSRPGDSSCERDVFNQIVAMCKSKILCRFRYEKKKASRLPKASSRAPKNLSSDPKNPLDRVVDRVREALQQLRDGVQVPKMKRYTRYAADMEAQIEKFLENLSRVRQIISNWLQHRVDSALCALIDGLCEFEATERWKEVVNLIPDELMEGSMRKSFINMVRKGARYRHAARILYRTAKKFPIAQRMRAIPVQLPESAFQRCQAPPSAASLDKTWKRVVVRKKHTVHRICQILKTSVPAANQNFDGQRRRTLAEGKFHAEVQLLHQILANPTPSPPRIVCASKDACFLCHLLIQAHAKIYTPRCHGKLYPGWRLPPGPEFRAVQISLNHILEQRIRDFVASLVQSGQGKSHQDGCESSCSTAILSDTTAAPTVADATDSEKGAAAGSESTSQEKTPTVSERSSSSSATIMSASQYDARHPYYRDSFTKAESSIRQSYALAQGEVVASSLPINKVSKIYTAEPLQVQLEYTKAERSILNERPPQLRYRIQQLTARETQTIRESSYVPIIDVALIGSTEERTFKLHEMADIYLRAGDCIFRLILEPANQS
ncbi:hypothetical protein NLG97_g2144 [Lecanicillium saksenae]|uniref:Uncharacterized protein n=1 Tax=Lecanicillium saksenae TaxID=468837 RepID=A0ACC1R4F7_9HYPO|nr:hypothetical protein NLG97_g2144 [Lecanicillium saksenae]